MSLTCQFRELFRLLRLTLEGRNPDMSRIELVEGAMDVLLRWTIRWAIVALVVLPLAIGLGLLLR